MKKAAIYIRVSTQEQAREGYSIAAQQEKLIAYCKAKNWLIHDIYIDGGFSGGNIDRPALKKMLNQIDRFDIALVYKLDRLSRSQKDTLYLIEENFLSNNVDFVSLSESFDTTTPFGRAMIGILSVFAQLERETIKERAKMGKEKRAKEGLWRGGGNVPLGYDFENNELIVNEYESIQIKEIFRLYLEGNGLKKIADILNSKGYKIKDKSKWTTTQVSRVLKNKTYAGYVEYDEEYYPGIHEAIIDEDIFDKAQKIIKKRSKNKITKSKYLLGGLLWCGYCGARLKPSWSSPGKNKSKFYFYICYSKAKSPPHMVKDANCPSQIWKMEKLDKKVVDELMKLPLSVDRIKKAYDKDKKVIQTFEDVQVLEEKIKELEGQINRLMDLYQKGTIPISVISERIEKLHEEKETIQNNISDIKNIQTTQDDGIPIEEILALLNNFHKIWSEATFEEKKVILNDLINKIMVSNEEIEIYWNLSSL